MRICGLIVAGLLLAASAAAAGPRVAAAPMETDGAGDRLPRLTVFSDLAIKAQVNAALAARETQNRAEYRDCLAQLKRVGDRPDKDAYSVRATVKYLSPRFFSILFAGEFFCGGAHPSSELTSMTFDLSTGRAIDWKTMFKPGFLPAETGASPGNPARVTILYRKYYPWSAKDEADFQAVVRKGQATAKDDCRNVIDETDPIEDADSATFWLEAGRGLVLSPDLPHVIQACGDEVVLPPSALASYLRDSNLLGELRGIQSRPSGASK